MPVIPASSASTISAAVAFFTIHCLTPRPNLSAASLGSQLSSVLAGGLSPFIATALLRNGYGRGALTLYLVGLAVLYDRRRGCRVGDPGAGD